MCGAVARAPAAASSCCPKSSSTERMSIWYCCCRTASVQMLGFPRTFSSGMGFQKKLRTRRFFLPLEVEVAGGGGGGSGGGGAAPGGGGGRGGGRGGGAESAWVFPDMEGVVMEEEEALQLLPSLLQLSGSWVVDGQLITSIPGRGGQRRCTADLRGKKRPIAGFSFRKKRLQFFTSSFKQRVILLLHQGECPRVSEGRPSGPPPSLRRASVLLRGAVEG